MLEYAQVSRRVPLLFVVAIALLFTFAPPGTTHSQRPSLDLSGLKKSSLNLSGPKQQYLALGDSLAFGPQRDGDFTHGYVDDLFQILQSAGTKGVTNLGCPSETSTTFINGSCPGSPGTPAQLTTAVTFLQAHPGKVSPVTLDIGANDVLHNITVTPRGCQVNASQFNADLATLDSNLTGTILPKLQDALTVNGRVKGNIVMMNYYDPFQNICPQSVPFIQTLNQHLADDVKGFGSIVDVFDAFGGATTPNPNICIFTWMCTSSPLNPDIHPTDKGHSIIADTFAAVIPQDRVAPR